MFASLLPSSIFHPHPCRAQLLLFIYFVLLVSFSYLLVSFLIRAYGGVHAQKTVSPFEKWITVYLTIRCWRKIFRISLLFPVNPLCQGSYPVYYRAGTIILLQPFIKKYSYTADKKKRGKTQKAGFVSIWRRHPHMHCRL